MLLYSAWQIEFIDLNLDDEEEEEKPITKFRIWHLFSGYYLGVGKDNADLILVDLDKLLPQYAGDPLEFEIDSN